MARPFGPFDWAHSIDNIRRLATLRYAKSTRPIRSSRLNLSFIFTNDTEGEIVIEA